VKNVRVAGHCGCPPPQKPWLEYRDSETGKKLVPTLDSQGRDYKAQFESFKLDTSEYIFVDDPSAVGAAFVPSYHIDTQEGLNFFVASLREAGVVPAREA